MAVLGAWKQTQRNPEGSRDVSALGTDSSLGTEDEEEQCSEQSSSLGTGFITKPGGKAEEGAGEEGRLGLQNPLEMQSQPRVHSAKCFYFILFFIYFIFN